MIKAYKTEIKPTPKQIEKIKQTQGVCRFVYNLFIATNQERHQQGLKYLSGYAFSKYLNNEYRKAHSENCWIWEVSSKAVKQSILNADKAFKRFFKLKNGYPNFKKKHGKPVSIYCPRNSAKATDIKVERHRIQFPKLGWIRLKEFGYIPKGTPISATITEKAGRYYISCMYETKDAVSFKCSGEGIGVDVGLKSFAVSSDGSIYENINKSLNVKKAKKRLIKEQRRFSRKIQNKKLGGYSNGSFSNIDRQRLKVQKAYHRLECIRKDFVNKVVCALVKTKPRYITIEDLNIQGMMKNRHLSRAIAESLFFYFRTKLTRKCKEYGIEIRVADRFYPSSKQCHVCGSIKKNLKLKDREYCCMNCGVVTDRDLNAALNLKNCEQFKVP